MIYIALKICESVNLLKLSAVSPGMCSKLLILAVCLWASAAQSGQIRGKLTEQQIQRIFHRNSNEVPKYKTVSVQTEYEHRSKRETRPVEFEIDGKTVQLKLNPAEHDSVPRYIPVWTVESTPNAPYHAFKKLDLEDYKVDGIVYQDIKNMATLLAYYKDSYIHYDGVFGESNMAKVVRSVPEKWWTKPDHDFSTDHVVYNVENANGTTQPIEVREKEDSEKLAKPLHTLYPKLLVVIENNYFKKFGQDVAELVGYLTTFWNSVNLEYSKLSSPKVKIIVTGVIIAKDDLALKYIHDSRDPADMKKMDNVKLLLGGGRYFKNEFNKYVNFKNYDATINLVDLDSGPVLGAAFVSRICHEELNVGFMRDDASYDGLQTATHELGHLLSLPHDGQGDAQKCESYPIPNVSTIMSAYAIGVEEYVWSECSKNILGKFASTKAAECMKVQHRTRD